MLPVMLFLASLPVGPIAAEVKAYPSSLVPELLSVFARRENARWLEDDRELLYKELEAFCDILDRDGVPNDRRKNARVRRESYMWSRYSTFLNRMYWGPSRMEALRDAMRIHKELNP